MYSYSNEEFRETFQELYRQLTFRKNSVANPKGYLLGGQPGSGKTTLQKILKNKDSNIVIIDGDTFRQYHPRYEEIIRTEDDYVPYTQAFCNKMVEKLIDELSNARFNLVIEGTLRTCDVPLHTAATLKDKGYGVELWIMAVPPELSWQGTKDRYDAMNELGMNPRFTTREHHDRVVNAIASNLDFLYKQQIFDDIRMYNRQQECLYSYGENMNQNPARLLNTILETELQVENIKKSNKRRGR